MTGVSVHVAVSTLKVRFVSGTWPVIASCPAGAASDATGVRVRVMLAAVVLRTRAVTTEPVRPKSMPVAWLRLMSSGAKKFPTTSASNQ